MYEREKTLLFSLPISEQAGAKTNFVASLSGFCVKTMDGSNKFGQIKDSIGKKCIFHIHGDVGKIKDSDLPFVSQKG